jgi:glycosyltransferase involved in cell wall biosynthesis
MKKILYLGNKFNNYKGSKSALENLEPLLSEFCNLKTASDKKNQLYRLVDMFIQFIRYGYRSDKIIIDVFSSKAIYFAYFFSKLSVLIGVDYILVLRGGNLPKRYLDSTNFVKSIFCDACHIIAPSPYLKLFFQEQGFKVKLIPNMIELYYYPFKERIQFKPKFITIRGFGKPYNPIMTLRAMIEVKKRFPDFRLLMLGNKDEYHYQQVMDFIKNNFLSENVIINSKKNRDKWVEIAADYDFMISNPLIDNTPVSVIEGMALGLCVISTNVGGIPHLVDESECAMVESDNPSSLAATIVSLIENPHMAMQLSKNGRRKSEEFDWFRVKSLWYEIIYS